MYVINRCNNGIGKTPYEALFGCKMGSLPVIKLDALSLNCSDGTEPITDEKFTENLQPDKVKLACSIQFNIIFQYVDENSENFIIFNEPCEEITIDGRENLLSEAADDDQTMALDNRQNQIRTYREYVTEKQRKQADSMLKSTNQRFGSVEEGTTVRIPIDQVDRGKTDPKNILAVVMENSGDGYYQLGTKAGKNNFLLPLVILLRNLNENH